MRVTYEFDCLMQTGDALFIFHFSFGPPETEKFRYFSCNFALTSDLYIIISHSIGAYRFKTTKNLYIVVNLSI